MIAALVLKAGRTRVLSRLMRYNPSCSMSSIERKIRVSASTACALNESYIFSTGISIGAIPFVVADPIPKWQTAARLGSILDFLSDKSTVDVISFFSGTTPMGCFCVYHDLVRFAPKP